MPYTGPDDASLPANVKKLPLGKRKQWVEVFNSAMAKNKPEGTAMMMANGVAAKELAGVVEGDKEHGEKHDMGYDAVPSSSYVQLVQEVNDPPPPLGGATSFADYDIYDTAQDLDDNVRELRCVFTDICANIWNDEDLTLAQKGAAVAQAARDFSDRIAAGPDEGQKSFLDKARSLFGVKAKNPDDYADVPDKNTPSTWKLDISDATHIAGAITALEPAGFRGNKVQIGSSKSVVVSRISGAISKLPDSPQKDNLKARLSKVKEYTEQDSAIWVAADKETGRPRWFAVHSNRYEDREGEIFPESGHKAYEAYVDRTHDFPEIRAWHVPGSRFGKADFVAYADGFMTSSGLFDEGMEYVAENLKALNDEEPQGVSHGYYYPEEGLIDGIYEGGYRTHEITVLPQKNTSNWWTSVSNVKEVLMGYTAEKAAYLDRLVGPEKRKAVEKNLKELDEVLQGSGVGLKEITEAFASKDAPAAAAAPEVPAPAAPTAEAAKNEEKDQKRQPGEELPNDPKVGEESAAEKAIGGIVERVVSRLLEPIAAQQSIQATAIKELQRTDDEKVADTIAGKKSTSLDAPRPTAGNEITPEKAAEKGVDPNDAKAAKELAEKGARISEGLGDTPVAPYLMQLMGGAGRGRIPTG